MAVFKFQPTVPVPERLSACLGVSANAKFADADINKAVKLGTANNYVPVAAGDDIEGFVDSIEPATYNSGFSFGAVQINGSRIAQVGTNQGSAMAVGDYVVADTPVALGTAGYAQVKTGVTHSQLTSGNYTVTLATPKRFFWRCIRIESGTGVAGDLVLLRRE